MQLMTWKAALEAAITCGEIFVAEWLLAQGAEWPGFDGGPPAALAVASAGRLDVLKWLDTKGQVEGVVGLVVCAAQKGDVAHWAFERDAHDICHWLTGLGGEASLAIHIAATNGHLHVAKYLRTHVQTPENAREWALEAQAQNMLRKGMCMPQFTSWSNVLPVSGETMTLAAESGHLDVVKWRFEEYGGDPAIDIFSEGKKAQGQYRSSFAMVSAASNGHLAVVKYLHQLEILMNSTSNKRKRSELSSTE
jgi:hypothetical protein